MRRRQHRRRRRLLAALDELEAPPGGVADRSAPAAARGRRWWRRARARRARWRSRSAIGRPARAVRGLGRRRSGVRSPTPADVRRRDQHDAARPRRADDPLPLEPAARRRRGRARHGVRAGRDRVGARDARRRAPRGGRPRRCWWRRAPPRSSAGFPACARPVEVDAAPRSMPRFAEARRAGGVERWLLPPACLPVRGAGARRGGRRAGLRALPARAGSRCRTRCAAAAASPAFGDLECRLCAALARRASRGCAAPSGSRARRATRSTSSSTRAGGASPRRWPTRCGDLEPLTGQVSLIPVPLGARRLRTRGYNQSERLAAALGARVGLPVRADLLRRRAGDADPDGAHARGAAGQRGGRLRGARRGAGCACVLVDDVFTTGATLAAAAAALAAGGRGAGRGGHVRAGGAAGGAGVGQPTTERRWQFESASTASAGSGATWSGPRRRWASTDLDFVAVNDLTDTKTLAHLLKYDSVHGRFPGDVERREADGIVVDGDAMRVLAEKDPAKLPWKDLGVDVVLESTGRFTDRDQAALHLTGRRQEGDHLRAGQEGRHHHRLRRQPREVRRRPSTTSSPTRAAPPTAWCRW